MATENQAKPVYVLVGRDAFLRDAHRGEILAHLLAGADPQLCVTTCEADAPLSDVLDELRTLPFLAPYRVVIVRDADAFISGNRKDIEGYLQKPSRTASLILEVASWPSNTNLYKIVAKIGQVFQCSLSGAAQVRSFATDAAARRGKKLSRQAVDRLAEQVGEDLGALDTEIEKLSLYVGDRETISDADVGAVVTASAAPVDFALTNALTTGQAAAALTALDDLLGVRGEEFRVLGSLAWHLRTMLTAQQHAARGQDPQRALNPRLPYQQKQAILGLLKRRPLAALQRDFRRLIAADLAMKSGAEPVAALAKLIVELCN